MLKIVLRAEETYQRDGGDFVKGWWKNRYSIRWRILLTCVSLMAAGLGLAGILIRIIYQEAQINSAGANGCVLVDQIADNMRSPAGDSGLALRRNPGKFI